MLRRLIRKISTPYCWGMSSAEMGTRNESWSQFGEDQLLKGLLDLSRKGTYVDVGAYNSMFYSNTYFLYRMGWSGIAIDANPDVENSFRKARPRDSFVHSAISRTTGTVKLKRFQCGAFNCLESHAVNVPEAFRKDENTIEVPCESLASILRRNNVANIDLLNVDCEGVDLEVLQSSDWDIWCPAVVCVEDHSTAWMESDIANFMGELKYTLKYRVGPSTIFVRNTI